MAKTKISEFSATPANNTDIDSINIAEGCAPSGINDAIRELMSQLKDFQTGAQGDSFNGPIGSTTPAAGAFTTLSASSTATLSGLTASTALALDASKNIVSVTNTGTGSNVLATSPTLVTPNLGVPSFATLTSATGLPISTGVSGLGSNVATFLATPSSANLAAAVTDETGSGALVFATSPTLVTPALGSPSSVGTMPAFTLGGTVAGGGNQINNVIIGTSTPLAGAFTTLTASTAIGTASGGTGLGGATPFTSGGVVFASSTSALSTGSALTFDGTIFKNDSASVADISVRSALGNAAFMRIAGNANTLGTTSFDFVQGSDSSAFIFNRANAPIVFGTNNTEGLRLTSTSLYTASGINVGIGTSSPAARLSVIAASANSTAATIGGIEYGGSKRGLTIKTFQSNGGDDCGVEFNAANGFANYGSFKFAADTTTLATLDSAGNLGLGQPPSAWSQGRGFELLAPGMGLWNGSGSPSSIYVMGNAYFNSGFKYGVNGQASHYYQYLGQHVWSTAPSGTAGDAITFTQAMTLDASGNLLVGKTSSGNGINGAQLSPTTQFFTNTNDYIGLFNRKGTDGVSIYFQKDETNVGNISVTTSATAYNTSSDYRLKNITGPITTSGAYIDSLNPVEGTWKADGSIFVGLIAHEAQEASRTTVATGTKDGAEMQSMDYSNSELIANLIAEIQSLRQRLSAANL